ncbi:unnamed protein product [Diatraea saccharalis]|uniref:Uncharacterized protein n=1 Tax=Diatraea saccharalis TaxID=40085 RepID=A0A9N9WIP8_9NEOP|nr:unnamed protein product [Diatraea saccharalis]
MVLADFLTETRRRWLKAFKLFKRSRSHKNNRNRISPALVRLPSYSGTVDARSEIDLQRFCACRASLPPLRLAQDCDSASYHSGYNSYSSRNESENDSNFDGARSDSAYDSARSSPSQQRAPVCYATVTYFNVNDSEDSSSIRTEYTLLDYEVDAEHEDELTQNMINENIELVSTL